MHHSQEPARDEYPHGRGYGHDYMRGGEVLGGYGYSERDEYERTRGELLDTSPIDAAGSTTHVREAPSS
jgi:hypothetical protein